MTAGEMDHDALQQRAGRLSLAEWTQTLDALGLRIFQLAVICGVSLLEPGVIEHWLQPPTSASQAHHAAAEELHGLLHLYFLTQERMLQEQGPLNASLVREQLRSLLREHGLPPPGDTDAQSVT